MSTENTHYGADAISSMLQGVRSIYFIGIGGINMSSLAHISLLRGYRVGGSDRTPTALTQSLSDAGIHINYSHLAGNIDSYEAVVYTVAISPDNPEYTEALRRGIPCISRADYLGYVMTGYRRRIGISGMHGKSTCTSMCAEVFMYADADPTVLCGAELPSMGGAYRVGGEDNFIFEACEYMDSFLDFNPTVAVILNIEMDHVDYFHSMEQIRTSYANYAAITGNDGFAVANRDDEDVTAALEKYEGHIIGFGIDSDAEFRALNISRSCGSYEFDIFRTGDFFCHVALSVPGYHNIYNALACAACADLCGISPDKIAGGLHAYGGAARRMEFKGRINGAAVYDDYGHHPTEVKTTLIGASALKRTGGRLWCIFQPHTYSRTKALFDGFTDALRCADMLLVADIYPARETDTLGVSSALLAQSTSAGARYCQNLGDAAEILCREVTDGDVVVVMGAGDVYKIFGYLGDRMNTEKITGEDK